GRFIRRLQIRARTQTDAQLLSTRAGNIRDMFEMLAGGWVQFVDWFSAHAIEPVLAFLHIDASLGAPESIAEALLLAGVQIAVIAGEFRPLESLAPVEVWQDRKLTKVDRLATLVLVGLNPLFAFLALTPLANAGGADQ